MSSSDPHPTPARRRVQLPGGRFIEVVYLHDEATAPAAEPRELHRCPACSGRFVLPVDWSEAGADRWEVSLRCPECDWSQCGLYTQAEVERFDTELDRGTEVLLRDLQSLAHANMAEQVEGFVRALERDLVVPSDF